MRIHLQAVPQLLAPCSLLLGPLSPLSLFHLSLSLRLSRLLSCSTRMWVSRSKHRLSALSPYLSARNTQYIMLSEKMINALNEQIAFEGYASFLYLAQAGWFENKSMVGCASFMYRQSAEEHMHMMKIFRYLLEMDAVAISPAIKQPPAEFKDVRTIFSETLAHEKRVTASINDLVALAIKESDHATYAFLQWYVTEQREEESLMRTILDKINLIGDGAQSLYFIDKEIEALNQATVAAEKAEGGE